jgi:putative MFS transporter
MAPSIHWLIGLRFIMGLGLGAEIVVTYATLTEFIPARLRGRALALLVISGALTLFAASLLSYLVIPTYGWRPCFVVIGVAALFLSYLRKVMPESPRWLVLMGRYKEAEQALRTIEGDQYQICPPISPEIEASQALPPFSTLFEPGLLSRTLATASISIAVNIALYSFTNWLPSFLV